MRRICILFLSVLLSMQARSDAQLLQPKSELLSLKLIPIDLTYANQLMTAYDLDEDGVIDKSEQERIRWRDEVKELARYFSSQDK